MVRRRGGLTCSSSFGQLAGLMSKLPKIKEEMAKFQATAPTMTPRATPAAAWLGQGERQVCIVAQCLQSTRLPELEDREMLEDLIAAATNQAIDKRAQAAGR